MLHLRVSHSTDLPSIVFLHAIGTSGSMWEEQFTQLPDFHCLAPDLPGHGSSRPIAWRSLEQTADLVADVIRTVLPLKRAHIVGLSLGSYVGLTLLARHPDIVERAVLSGINVLPLPGQRLINAATYLIGPLIKTSIGARLNARALKIPEWQFESYRQSLRQLSLRSFVAASHQAGGFLIPANIAEIQSPTLILAGEQEHPLILQSLARLHQLLPDSQVKIAKAVGHAWSAERPDLFSASVRAWCRQSELPDELMELRARGPA